LKRKERKERKKETKRIKFIKQNQNNQFDTNTNAKTGNKTKNKNQIDIIENEDRFLFGKYAFSIHVTSMPPAPSGSILAQIAVHSPRSNASVKHMDWLE